MKVTPVKFDPESITGPKSETGLPRSGGLHLSQIYFDLDEVNKKRYANNPLPLVQLQTYRSGGFVWEQAFSKAMADALANEEWIRPGEFTLDGITGSPDLIGQRDWILGETKFTWRSAGRLESLDRDFWVWLVQMKGYSKMIGTNKARLFAFFVNGAYKDMRPQLHVLDFEFSNIELRENWEMIVGHARRKGWL